jgi:hypothetical protein
MTVHRGQRDEAEDPIRAWLLPEQELGAKAYCGSAKAM